MIFALAAMALAEPMFPDDPSWKQISDTEFSTAWANLEVENSYWYPAFRIAHRNKKDKQQSIDTYAVNCRDLSVASAELWLTTDGTVNGVVEASSIKDGIMNFLPSRGVMRELAKDACARYFAKYGEASK